MDRGGKQTQLRFEKRVTLLGLQLRLLGDKLLGMLSGLVPKTGLQL